VTARIGIKRAIDWPLRFTLPGHPCVSGPRRFEGSCIFLARIPSTRERISTCEELAS